MVEFSRVTAQSDFLAGRADDNNKAVLLVQKSEIVISIDFSSGLIIATSPLLETLPQHARRSCCGTDLQ